MSYNYPEIYLLGGGKEVRTPDPLLAKQVLSQLSYTPSPYPFGRAPAYSRCLGYLASPRQLSLPPSAR